MAKLIVAAMITGCVVVAGVYVYCIIAEILDALCQRSRGW